jgi:hypothetical protein
MSTKTSIFCSIAIGLLLCSSVVMGETSYPPSEKCVVGQPCHCPAPNTIPDRSQWLASGPIPPAIDFMQAQWNNDGTYKVMCFYSTSSGLLSLESTFLVYDPTTQTPPGGWVDGNPIHCSISIPGCFFQMAPTASSIQKKSS